MEKDKECVLNINIFNKYWKLLLLNYSKKDTQTLHNFYYSMFKSVKEKDFIIAIREAIKNQPYFPNVNEIYRYLPHKIENWENIEKEITSEEEQKELRKLLEIE